MKSIPRILLCLCTVLLGISYAGKIHAAPYQLSTDKGNRPLQDYAPEFLEIKNVSVTIKTHRGILNNGHSDITIKAEVTQVYRTDSNLKPGQPITIQFERPNSVGFGDVTPTVPAEGSTTVAFLRKDGDHYIPDAKQYTFVPLTAEQMAKINPRPKSAMPVPQPQVPVVITKQKASPATPPPSSQDIQLRPEDNSSASPASGTEELPSKSE